MILFVEKELSTLPMSTNQCSETCIQLNKILYYYYIVCSSVIVWYNFLWFSGCTSDVDLLDEVTYLDTVEIHKDARTSEIQTTTTTTQVPALQFVLHSPPIPSITHMDSHSISITSFSAVYSVNELSIHGNSDSRSSSSHSVGDYTDSSSTSSSSSSFHIESIKYAENEPDANNEFSVTKFINE